MPKPPKGKAPLPEIKILNQKPKVSTALSKKESIDKEIGGPKGPEPTRYGDWEKNGRCTDF